MNENPPDDPILDPKSAEALLLGLNPVEPDRERKEAMRRVIMERIRPAAQIAPLNFLTIRANEGEWTRLTPLVEMKLLYSDVAQHSRSFLLRMHPGASLPAHDHPADEECLVLEGEVMLGDIAGRAGDYHLAPKGLPHGTITTKTGALLFIRAGDSEHAA